MARGKSGAQPCIRRRCVELPRVPNLSPATPLQRELHLAKGILHIAFQLLRSAAIEQDSEMLHADLSKIAGDEVRTDYS